MHSVVVKSDYLYIIPVTARLLTAVTCFTSLFLPYFDRFNFLIALNGLTRVLHVNWRPVLGHIEWGTLHRRLAGGGRVRGEGGGRGNTGSDAVAVSRGRLGFTPAAEEGQGLRGGRRGVVYGSVV